MNYDVKLFNEVKISLETKHDADQKVEFLSDLVESFPEDICQKVLNRLMGLDD